MRVLGTDVRRRPRRISAAVVLVSLTGSVGCLPDPSNPPKPSSSLTLLSLNLRGINDVPCNEAANNYRVRANRVGAGLKASGAVPDVIALQEVTGWMWCTFDHQFVRDYGLIDALLAGLESGTGVAYRVAYMTAIFKGSGNFHCTKDGTSQHACEARSGLALLYNPARIRNLMADTPASEAADAYAHDAAMQPGPHLVRSLPLCNPVPGSTVETRIDGPAQRDKCNRDTPSGLSWVVGDEAALARLAFTDTPGSVFHVYNVHLAWQTEPHVQHVGEVNTMVTLLEERFAGTRWIPPIMMGDFNLKTDENSTIVDKAASDFPAFEARGHATADDIIIAGKADSFPSSARIRGHVSAEMPAVPESQGGCHSPQHLWSDHCAVMTTLRIQDP
jgi:endonuclease/exonuclease/phosphatase family metal-dependent hydrolase